MQSGTPIGQDIFSDDQVPSSTATLKQARDLDAAAAADQGSLALERGHNPSLDLSVRATVLEVERDL